MASTFGSWDPSSSTVVLTASEDDVDVDDASDVNSKKWVSGESGARWQEPGTKMEGALFAGNNDFSNIKQYQTLKLIITKIATITCAGCCDGSEPPTEDLTKTYLAIKEGI